MIEPQSIAEILGLGAAIQTVGETGIGGFGWPSQALA